MLSPNRIITFIQLCILFLYFILIFYSIIIFPLNIFLGLTVILILPGYNLLNVLKPNFNLIKKFGYITIFSLTINNLIMFFSYLFLYDLLFSNEHPGFIFDSKILLLTIIITNIILIVANEFISKNERKRNILAERNQSIKYHSLNINTLIFRFQSIKKTINLKILIICLIFILSLIFLSISVLSFQISNKQFLVVHNEYKLNYTFFHRVPWYFYLFLGISIITLTYIILYSKNLSILLFSISGFLYCLWILPYFQIGNYFGIDSYLLSKSLKFYEKNGIRPKSGLGFTIANFFRYSTSVFTAILLTSATGVSIDFALWYLYPIIFLFIPFFFYGVFQEFSMNKISNINENSVILTLLSIFSIEFLKCAHSATTMVLGMYIFFILVIEFFNLIKTEKIKFRDIFTIDLLYFFLCLTHLEECIYFLLIIVLSIIYFVYFKNKNYFIERIKKNKLNYFIFTSEKKKKESDKNSVIIRFSAEKIRIICINLWILIIIFYFTQEFFGFIEYYFRILLANNSYSTFIVKWYIQTKTIPLPYLKGNTHLNYIIIILIGLSFIIFIPSKYSIFYRFYPFIFRMFFILERNINAILGYLKKIFTIKLIKIIIILLSFFIILVLNWYMNFLQEKGFYLIIELILNYSIIIFHISLFLSGIQYYKINNHKQNYFLISIFSSTSFLFIFLLTGNLFFAYHILNSRLIPIFIFFNLIIIQNTYIDKFMNMKSSYLSSLVIILMILGTFLSLNKIGWE